MKLKCTCGEDWKIQDNLSAYDGEVVLVCLKCGARYFNAQESFSDEDLKELEHLIIKGTSSYSRYARKEIDRLQYGLDRSVERIMNLSEALESIRKVLGPSAPTCEGCSTEIAEALKIIKEVL